VTGFDESVTLDYKKGLGVDCREKKEKGKIYSKIQFLKIIYTHIHVRKS
jgi:hypothetical protein